MCVTVDIHQIRHLFHRLTHIRVRCAPVEVKSRRQCSGVTANKLQGLAIQSRYARLGKIVPLRELERLQDEADSKSPDFGRRNNADLRFAECDR